MAPYKLEDNIREKLEAREINPSAEAWKKLEAKLDLAQPEKKSYTFYYVAASFVGLLILASVFFGRNNSEVNNPIVDEKIQQNQNDSQNEIIPNKINAEEIASGEKNSEKTDAEKKQEPVKKEIIQLSPKKSAIDKKIDRADAIAKVSNETNKPIKKENQVITDLSSEALAKGEEENHQ